MNKNGVFEIISRLTEWSVNYKWINPNLLIAYYGLPKQYTKLSLILFLSIIKNKLYKEKARTKSINEDKRIYTDIEITVDDILREGNNYKYACGKKIDTDRSNLLKRIKELSDNNVFYHWEYKRIYMFILEREFCIWKFYNPNGYVIPKTICKIASVSNDIIFCMNSMARKRYNDADRYEIDKSFGLFINSLIDKMSPLVSNKITKWNNDIDIKDYISKLLLEMDNMSKDNGFLFEESVLEKLPSSLFNKINCKLNEGSEMENKSNKDLEKDLVPKNQNMVKKPKMKKIKTEPIITTSLEPQKPVALGYIKSVNPLENSLQFAKYYRSFLSVFFNGEVEFDTLDSDAQYAAQILDSMILEKRDNKIFLDAWLTSFCQQNLKGTKAMKTKYTSLRVLKSTFDDFKVRFFIPN